MVEESDPVQLKCHNCGIEAPAGDSWNDVPHPPIGTMTHCPECESTDVHGL